MKAKCIFSLKLIKIVCNLVSHSHVTLTASSIMFTDMQYLNCLYVKLRCTTVQTCCQNTTQMNLNLTTWSQISLLHSYLHLFVRNCDRCLTGKQKKTKLASLSHTTRKDYDGVSLMLINSPQVRTSQVLLGCQQRWISWIDACNVTATNLPWLSCSLVSLNTTEHGSCSISTPCWVSQVSSVWTACFKVVSSCRSIKCGLCRPSCILLIT